AAKRYGAVAPEAGHARHMPSHIFSRLGMWHEALASNESAWKASEAWIARKNLPIDKRDYHALNWMSEINFELGKRKSAEQVMKIFMESAAKATAGKVHRLYGLQLVSYLERTGDWGSIGSFGAPLANLAGEEKKSESGGTESCGAHGTAK